MLASPISVSKTSFSYSAKFKGNPFKSRVNWRWIKLIVSSSLLFSTMYTRLSNSSIVIIGFDGNFSIILSSNS